MNILYPSTLNISLNLHFCHSQVNIVPRLVNWKNPKETHIREDFVMFIDAFGELTKDTYDKDEKSNDKGAGTIVEENNSRKEIWLTGAWWRCVGIGTNACIAMLGDRGALGEIQKGPRMVSELHVFLISSISKSAMIDTIKKISKIIREVPSFLKASNSKRNTVFAEFLGRKIVQLCRARWAQKDVTVL